MAADNIVTVHANGVADRNRGAWAASLAFGEHRRTESGAETGADLERTQLLAVVRALDYLTRPSLGNYIATPYELQQRAGAVFGMIREGSLKLRIEHNYPLAQAAQAHRDLEGRKTTGKLLLIPS